ncbi:MAG: TIGR04282 family arsenosugar biosynthesis glycosyltransferase [Gammaproteobacteria bacterium]|nr:TIGR04282 family arsenosugar biosynthesis glycosyltransferase [Gammaproteobacteria bacterium]
MRILIFARAPVPGRCKTRLMPRLGAAGAARVHRQLVRRTLGAALATGLPVELWCAPDARHGWLQGLRRQHGLRLKRQAPGDLGRKMTLAIRDALARGADKVVVVGTDCPVLAPQDLRDAFSALDRHDCVIQPAADGGYVLIGARRLPARALAGIAWSTGGELRQTRSRLARLGLSCAELPARWDVDTPADYRSARRAGLL